MKITPAHDPNDYDVGQRHEAADDQHPQSRRHAQRQRRAVQGPDDHEGPRSRRRRPGSARACWTTSKTARSTWPTPTARKTPIEPYLADQWFVKMDELAPIGDGRRDRRPREDRSRRATPRGYLDWLGEKRDWPVGRQLWWGHRIPVWYAPTATRSAILTASLRRSRRTSIWRRDAEPRPVGSICAQDDRDLTERRDSRSQARCKTPTSSTPGSAPPSGRTRRSAGPSKRRSWPTSIPPAR